MPRVAWPPEETAVRIFGRGQNKIAILFIIKGIAIAFVIYFSYMWLSGMQTPDFRSKRLADRFDDIFTQIVLLLHDEGLVSLKVQYIDGTKIESVANKYTFVWKGSTEKNKAKLEANVRSVLKAAENALAMENAEEQQELSSEEMAKRAESSQRQAVASAELRSYNKERPTLFSRPLFLLLLFWPPAAPSWL